MQTFMPEGRNAERPPITLSTLSEAMERRRILEAKAIMCDSEHNLIVDLDGIRGVIPREEGAVGIREGSVRDIALISRVNKPVCFTVSRVTQECGKPTALLSRRDAQEKCAAEYIAQLQVGDIIPARVTHLENFGAFCDIGCGVIALMPIDAISVSRISHPRDRFVAGDDVYAVVRAIDENGRISLSHRELLGSWQQNADRFMQGQTVSGIIRTVEDYGVFVELTPNLAGLAELKSGVMPGQQASVYIKSIIPEKMKIKLIIIDSFDASYDPPQIEYFFDGDHLDSWRYSPESCSKRIETSFNDAYAKTT